MEIIYGYYYKFYSKEMQLRAAPGELNNKNEKAVFEIVRKNKAE